MATLLAVETRRFFGGSVSAAVAQLVERVLGKDEVMGSSPISSSVDEVRFGCRFETKLLLTRDIGNTDG